MTLPMIPPDIFGLSQLAGSLQAQRAGSQQALSQQSIARQSLSGLGGLSQAQSIDNRPMMIGNIFNKSAVEKLSFREELQKETDGWLKDVI